MQTVKERRDLLLVQSKSLLYNQFSHVRYFFNPTFSMNPDCSTLAFNSTVCFCLCFFIVPPAIKQDTIGWHHPVDESDQWDGFNEPGMAHFTGNPQYDTLLEKSIETLWTRVIAV